MTAFEYKVVPAPTKGEKARGVKGAEARFSHALENLMNTMAEEGWEYQRAETLPSDERSGLTSTVTVWRNVLVFRRARRDVAEAFEPRLLEKPAAPLAAAADSPVVAETAAPKDMPVISDPPENPAPAPAQKTEDPVGSADDTPYAQDTSPDEFGVLPDNGVEDTSAATGISALLSARAQRGNS